MESAAVIAVSLPAVAAVAYFQLRHAALAALAISFPLVFVAGFSALFYTEAAQYGPYAFLFGVICAQLTGAKFVRGVCNGATPRDVARRACLETAGAVGPVFVVYFLVALIFAMNAGIPQQAVAAIFVSAAALGAALAAGWFAQYLRYSEQFIARANRVRERGERQAEFLLWVTQARWALSVTGIVLVLAAVAFFGTKGLRIHDGAQSMGYLAAAIVLLPAAFLATARDWRCAVALTLAFVPIVMFTLWTLAREGFAIGPPDLLIFGIVLLAALAPMTVFAGQISRAMRAGDDHASALAKTLWDETLSVFLAGLVLILPTLFKAIALETVPPVLVTALVAQVSALVAFPALMETIYAMIPRYRSVEDVFSKH